MSPSRCNFEWPAVRRSTRRAVILRCDKPPAKRPLCQPASALLATALCLSGAAFASTPPAKAAPPTQAPAVSPSPAKATAVPRPASGAPQPSPATPSNDALIELDLHVGESRVLPAPGVARLAVGNGQVLSASALDQREVLVFANAAGASTLFVWNRQGQITRYKLNVSANDAARLAREVQTFLGPVAGLRVAPIGDKVIVEGEALSDADLARIEQLAQRYPQLVNFTHRQGWEQMVTLDVKVVEFPINDLRELGLRWTANGGAALGAIWSPVGRVASGAYTLPGLPAAALLPPGQGALALPTGRAAAGGGANLGLSATLQALAQTGRTTLLAEPQLSARNGAKASFLAGGELPFSVATPNGTTIQFKPYGVRLDIQPRVDRLGNVRATIETEFSQIDPSVRTGDAMAVPGLLVRRTNTEFNVRPGETIVLSGLIQREQSSTVDKVPGLGDMPVLGALFRSKRFQNRETELVVFVTPVVVDPRSPRMAERAEEVERRALERLAVAERAPAAAAAAADRLATAPLGSGEQEAP